MGGSALIGVSQSADGGSKELRPSGLHMGLRLISRIALGWTKFMEWKYPVEVVITSKKSFKAAGLIEAAATL